MSLKPFKLFDFLKQEYGIKSDAKLGKALGINAVSLCRIRSRQRPVTAEIIISIYKKTGMSIEDIEAMIEDKDEKVTDSPVAG